MNKKGMELSMNFIIIAALALIALIVIALIFTGGIDKIIGQQKDIVELTSSEIALAEGVCKTACSADSKAQWDNPSFTSKVKEFGYENCEDILNGYKWEDEDTNCVAP